MSFNIKIKTPNPKAIADKIRKIHSAEFVKQVNETVVDGTIKKLIRSGQSPVDGFGRFVQYKDKDTYPAKEKPATPVNLTLKGEMLNKYKAESLKSNSLRIGISKDASKKIKDRAKGNNVGTLDLEGKKFDKALRKKLKKEVTAIGKKGQLKTDNQNKVARGSKGIPARRFIPIKGESFTVSVMRALKNLYSKRIKALLS